MSNMKMKQRNEVHKYEDMKNKSEQEYKGEE